MEIKELLTNVNYNKGNNRKIEYIVIHYVGAVSTALNNAIYFNKEYRGASAHYFVDENDTYRVVKDEDIAWHCGTKGQYYNECRNSNSIGIEMCCYDNDGTLDMSETVINKTIELVKELMAKYNIPVENIIRHYDVTHKICPAPFVKYEYRWNEFRSKLDQSIDDVQTKPDEVSDKVSNKIDVKYQAYTNKWLSDIINYNEANSNGYAGILGEAISSFKGNTIGNETEAGKLIYCVHSNGRWLGEVTDREKDKHGDNFAGNLGQPIDGIMIKATKGTARYRVHILGGGWLPWVTGYDKNNSKNGYAGIIGKKIDAIQVEII